MNYENILSEIIYVISFIDMADSYNKNQKNEKGSANDKRLYK